MLQLNPTCGLLVKDIIESTAYTDTWTPAISPPPSPAHPAWGYGKLNVSKAIEATMNIPVIWDIQQNPTSPDYNETVTVTANISNADFVMFDWTNIAPFEYDTISRTIHSIHSGAFVFDQNRIQHSTT